MIDGIDEELVIRKNYANIPFTPGNATQDRLTSFSNFADIRYCDFAFFAR